MNVTQVRIELPSDMHRDLKYRALDERRPLTKLLRELIEVGLKHLPTAKAAKK